jgi:hypothetical protein
VYICAYVTAINAVHVQIFARKIKRSRFGHVTVVCVLGLHVQYWWEEGEEGGRGVVEWRLGKGPQSGSGL